jgi:hypothetical protein
VCRTDSAMKWDVVEVNGTAMDAVNGIKETPGP